MLIGDELVRGFECALGGGVKFTSTMLDAGLASS